MSALLPDCRLHSKGQPIRHPLIPCFFHPTASASFPPSSSSVLRHPRRCADCIGKRCNVPLTLSQSLTLLTRGSAAIINTLTRKRLSCPPLPTCRMNRLPALCAVRQRAHELRLSFARTFHLTHVSHSLFIALTTHYGQCKKDDEEINPGLRPCHEAAITILGMQPRSSIQTQTQESREWSGEAEHSLSQTRRLQHISIHCLRM